MPTDRSHLFNPESVSAEHPDKPADRVPHTARHILRGSVPTSRVASKTAAQMGGRHA